MRVRIIKAGAPASARELECLAREMGGSPPADFMSFLSARNGCQMEANVFRVGADNDSGIQCFLGVAEILNARARLGERLSVDTWPFADAEGGNYVCLRREPAGGWVVAFWDHELEEETCVAGSFGEFLESLEKFVRSSVELKPGQVISAWIDPGLLADRDD